jgi:trehalose 6-phosphate phosphatase
MPNRWKGWPRLLPHLKSGERLLLLLDFDGTLAPIVNIPHEARLPDGTRKILKRLQANPRVIVAIISGRSLPDVKHKAFLPGAYYAGNHGLEIEGPNTSFEYPRIRREARLIGHLAQHFHYVFQSVPGVIVQDKGLSLSIHYRNVKPQAWPYFDKLIKQSLIETSQLPIVWRKGRKVYEILPGVDWNKGRAAIWLIKKLNKPFALAFGDDKTDDTMFRALKETGLTTRIGKKRKLAHCSLKNPDRVAIVLYQLEKRLRMADNTGKNVKKFKLRKGSEKFAALKRRTKHRLKQAVP